MADGEVRERDHAVVPGVVPDDAPGRCPACGARTAAGVDWCPRCYAPLTTPADRGGQPPTAAAADEIRTEEARTDETSTAETSSAETSTAALADELLADLSAQTPPPLGVWSTRLASTPARVAVMVGGVVLVAGVLVGLMALIGLFLPTGG